MTMFSSFWKKRDDEFRTRARQLIDEIKSEAEQYNPLGRAYYVTYSLKKGDKIQLLDTEMVRRKPLDPLPVDEDELVAWIVGFMEENKITDVFSFEGIEQVPLTPEEQEGVLHLLKRVHDFFHKALYEDTLVMLLYGFFERAGLVEDGVEDGGEECFTIPLPIVQASTTVQDALHYLMQEVLQMREENVWWGFHETIGIVESYLEQKLDPMAFATSSLGKLFTMKIRKRVPLRARFEHMHIVGGTGHGKTQFIQHLLAEDLARVARGEASVVVIDSQGDLIRSILSLQVFSPSRGCLAERLLLIDPHDIEHPPCLNLFDFGQERAQRYSPVEREKLLNGAIALYDYLFGALLGSDLTQRQGLIFRYLARLMLAVEGGTIHTLREFCEHPDRVRPYLDRVDPLTREFFETQFFSRGFDGTRRQILTRLWGVCSSPILERMLGNPHNKVDMFDALNRGSVVLIHTAKDLLKQEGCELLGRFFIALIAQAAQERAMLPEAERLPTFVYIDEAQDYLDENVEYLLNQARKYRVGLILAHQNLDQLSKRIYASLMSSTTMKAVGGLSYQDARVFAREMRCDEKTLLSPRKSREGTQFMLWIRNIVSRPVLVNVPFGTMASLPQMSDEEREALLAIARQRVASFPEEAPPPDDVPEEVAQENEPPASYDPL